MNSDVALFVTQYRLQAKQLEDAYEDLRNRFYALKQAHDTSLHTLKQIVNHITDGLVFINQEGTILLFNPAAANILGYAADSVLQACYWDHFSDHLFGFSMEEALKKTELRQRVLLTLGNGKELEISTSSVPGQGIILLLCDCTERTRLENTIQQSERLKALGEMAATLAHEIRNPLGGIQGFAELLKRELTEPAHQKMIRAIVEGTHTLNQLVSQVLDYARPLQLHFSPTDLVALVHDTFALATIDQQTTQCNFISAHSAYNLSLDQASIKGVLLNLIRNAKEAGATTIDVTLSHDGTLRVKDNGKGIQPENLKKIFTPFFTTKAQGTGLGLAHTLAVITAHGGTIQVLSEEGKGTEFILQLDKAVLINR